MEKKMEKRADLTAKTLVTIILLVLGFGIVLFIYFQLNWTGRVDRETCHQSVVYRATLPSFAGMQSYVPLKCKAQKICITSGIIGGKCAEFENSGGVLKNKVKSGAAGQEQIERIIAQEIVDCWSMMGEGKVSLFSQWFVQNYGLGEVYPTCVICSRIAFDKAGLEKAKVNISKINVMNYMTTHKIPNGDISYYEYLVKERGKISVSDMFKEVSEAEAKAALDRLEAAEKEKDSKIQLSTVETLDAKDPMTLNNQTDELSVMFMQIASPKAGEVFQNTLETALVFFGLSLKYKPGAFVTTVTKAPTGAVWNAALGRFQYVGGAVSGSVKVGGQMVKGIVSKVITPFTQLAIATGIVTMVLQQGSVAYNRAVTAGYCGDVSLSGAASNGCSVVRTVNYDENSLSQYCSVIESIP